MSKSDDQSLRPATKLVQGGRRPEWTGDPRLGGGVVNPPVWRASTVLYDSIADLKTRGAATDDRIYYGRRGTPPEWALAAAMTGSAPGAEGSLLYPPGAGALPRVLLPLVAPASQLYVTSRAC